MNPINFSTITLKDFVQGSLGSEDKQGISEMLRAMQRGAFDILWNRCQTSIATKLYNTLGQAQQFVVPEGWKTSQVFKRISASPIIGKIRAVTAHGDDFRFISLMHKGQLYLLLENCANDSRLAQVWLYDVEGEVFVPSKDTKLINFLIDSEVTVNPV